jgi:hypothetical protein
MKLLKHILLLIKQFKVAQRQWDRPGFLAFPPRHFFALVFQNVTGQKTGRPGGRPALKQESTSV